MCVGSSEHGTGATRTQVNINNYTEYACIPSLGAKYVCAWIEVTVAAFDSWTYHHLTASFKKQVNHHFSARLLYHWSPFLLKPPVLAVLEAQISAL